MTKFGIGQPVARTEDPRFLTGRGRFVDDIALPGQVYAAVLRSPHAHALIRAIDTTKALAAPGVLLVRTGEHAVEDGLGGLPPMLMPEDMGGPKGGFRTIQPILADDRVRHVGDRVALVVAETAEQAKDALELIEIEYETLPAVVSVGEATRADAPRVWDQAPFNVGYVLPMGDRAATEAAFARARHVERLRLWNNRVSANTIEARSAVAAFDPASGYTLYLTCQSPHRVKQFVSNIVLKIPENRMRVVGPDVGGGFGMKSQAYPEESLVAWAAGKLGRPVKWTAERTESLMSDAHGRDQMDDAEMAFDGDGKILGLRVALDANMGAYFATAGAVPPIHCLRLLSNVYRIPAVYAEARAVFTHTAPTGTYRGAGRPEATYLVERLIEAAARSLRIDPVALRRRNLIAPAAMPYKTHSDITYDVGEFETVMDKALALADRGGFAARKAESERRGLRRGLGIGHYVELSALFNERMGLRVESDGSVVIASGTFSHGQGHETTYAQIVSDWLGVPPDKVRLEQGDTGSVPYGRGTFAARSLTVAVPALRKAADEIIAKGKRFAAHLLEAAEDDIEFRDGAFGVAGTDRRIPLAAIARAAHAPAGPLAAIGPIGLEGVGAAPSAENYPNGCHVCEVEVDIETGAVEVARFSAVDDVGVAVNPMLVDGQVHGGIAQGLGQALMEEVAYDRATGQLLTGSFLDYAMPRASDFPPFAVALHEVPTKTNPLGVKGAGEAGCVGAPAAAVNAILDALAPLGVTHIEMPATPERVWRAIREAGNGAT